MGDTRLLYIERVVTLDVTMLTTVAISIFSSIMGSTGLWIWFDKRSTRKSASTRLLLGMARDRIIFLGVKYIERGSLTRDEYDDYIHYFVEPYFTFGGNGLAEKIVSEVKALPIYRRPPSTGELVRASDGD